MAVNNKVKNAGRSKKSKNDDFVLMKSDTEINLEKAQAWLKVKDEIIADLEARLDISYREQDEMLKELSRSTASTSYHCSKVEENTGNILQEDVEYCLSLIRRTMEHKFAYKSQSWE